MFLIRNCKEKGGGVRLKLENYGSGCSPFYLLFLIKSNKGFA